MFCVKEGLNYMGLFDLFKNKKLCLDAYNKGDLAVIGGAINVMCQKKKTKDAVAILKYIAQKITITNDKEFGRAKELRKFWKKINPSSYKKDGLILKNKYKDYFNKHLIKQAEICTKLLNIGQTEVLQLRFKDFYEIDRNLGRAILKYMSLNACFNSNEARYKGTKLYANLTKIDKEGIIFCRYKVVGPVLLSKFNKIPMNSLRVMFSNAKQKFSELSKENHHPFLDEVEQRFDDMYEMMRCGFLYWDTVDVYRGQVCAYFLVSYVPRFIGVSEIICNIKKDDQTFKEISDTIYGYCKQKFGVDRGQIFGDMEIAMDVTTNKLDKVSVDEVVNRVIGLIKLMLQCYKWL